MSLSEEIVVGIPPYGGQLPTVLNSDAVSYLYLDYTSPFDSQAPYMTNVAAHSALVVIHTAWLGDGEFTIKLVGKFKDEETQRDIPADMIRGTMPPPLTADTRYDQPTSVLWLDDISNLAYIGLEVEYGYAPGDDYNYSGAAVSWTVILYDIFRRPVTTVQSSNDS